jgi:hypothetical protein
MKYYNKSRVRIRNKKKRAERESRKSRKKRAVRGSAPYLPQTFQRASAVWGWQVVGICGGVRRVLLLSMPCQAV